MKTSIKQLKDGEFGVSLKEGTEVQMPEFDGQEEIEIFSTWVKAKWTRISLPVSNKKLSKINDLGFYQKAKWTRISLPVSNKKLSKINDLGFYQHIDVTSSGVGGKDLTVRNNVDDETLEILESWNIISKHLYEYCVENQVDEIIFTYTSQT